jgi:hypothetical protein
MPDGRLLVWDTGNWRINVYSPAGDFITQWTTPSGMSGGGTAQYSRALFVDTAGTVITRKTIFDIRNAGSRPTLWLRFRPDGTPLDTIYEPKAVVLDQVSARVDRVSVVQNVPFAPNRVVAMSPFGYLVAGYPARYAFEIHQPGQAVVSVRRDVTPEPVSRSERAEGRKQVEDRMRQTDPAWSWNGPDVPSHKPLYYGLHVGLDGRIWVSLTPDASRIGGISGTAGVGAPSRRSAPDSNAEPPKPTLYDVFEPDGRYLGQVQLAAGVSPVLRKGEQVWAVAIGDDDVPRVKRYRIAWKN